MAKKRPPKANAKAGESEPPVDFEAAVAEIERIVSQLESGALGLNESLEQYERGIRQLKRCHALLDAAEQKVSLLSGFDADGNPVTEPLTTDRSSGAKAKASSTGASRPAKRRRADESAGRRVDDSEGLF